LYGNLLGAKSSNRKTKCDIGAIDDAFHHLEDTVMPACGWVREYRYGNPCHSVTLDTVNVLVQILTRRIMRAIAINDGETKHRKSITIRVGCLVNLMLSGSAEVSSASREALTMLTTTYRQITIQDYIRHTQDKISSPKKSGRGQGRGVLNS
jgi:hypothetical protein